MRIFPFLLALLLVVLPAAAGVSAAQAEGSGTWTARSSSGVTLGGTWTTHYEPSTGTVTGMWTLEDANRRPTARGGWSAAKAAKRWTGSWRAVVEGQKGEYSGTWAAKVDLKPDASFVDLFEAAVQQVVSGTWRTGSQSGAWSIRASK